MLNRVHISGMGIISAIGKNVEETFHSLSSGKTGIGKIRHLKTVHRNDFVAGEVPYSDHDLAAMAKTPAHNRSTLLAIIAAKEAMFNAGMTHEHLSRTGLISSTTVGGMTHTELKYKDFFAGHSKENFIDQHFSGAGTNLLAETLDIRDYVTTISTACSSAANAIMLGARLIKAGKLDRVIAGGTDALSLFTLNGFNTLMILDKDWCKPFDENRKGLNLGEAAAFLVLESESSLKKRNAPSIAILSGYGNANDAFHQTASSPEGQGAILSMNKALKVATLKPADIDYINAHGTGTPNNDSSEGQAMQTVFEKNVPPFSSTKAFTGHTLAAAASVEAVVSLLSLQHRILFPCLNREIQMNDLRITPLDNALKKEDLKHVMSNSFGFGGNCSTLIFSAN
jgi:3-oxoacyl-(acyl-carrier-protein) synthase